MTLLIAAALIHAFAGILSLIPRTERRTAAVGVAGAVGAGLCGLPPVIACLVNGSVETFARAWSVPYGSFSITLDPLAAFFLLPLFLIGPLASLYGAAYDMKKQGRDGTWFFLHGLLGGMALTVLSSNTVLFMISWEVMSVSAFFLVTRDHARETVRRAGRTYLIATHVGAAFILGFFLLAGRNAASLDFADLSANAGSTPAWLLLLFAFLGFGAKAGIMPLHFWLPEAHPAAPSHVSALMSGVMIKMGIYGILRVLLWVPLPSWLPWILILFGVMTGVWGILFALAQRDLKRLLAYSSVENIGIITLGIGVGLLGRDLDLPLIAAAGFCGALIHVLNHSLMKSLLFLAAGSVLHATGTTNMDRLGGLAKKMPLSASTFLVGSLSICALPPLCGFFGEFLLYLAGFHGLMTFLPQAAIPLSLAIGGLALIGGLAAASFTKAYGIVFLGQARSPEAEHAHEAHPAMFSVMIILAGGCVASGLAAPLVLDFVSPVVAQLTSSHAGQVRILMRPLQETFWLTTLVGAHLLFAIASLIFLRRLYLARRSVKETGTWDCGYAAPAARMQYTASSYAQPMIFSSLLRPWLRPRRRLASPKGLLPSAASMSTSVPDIILEEAAEPFLRRVADLLVPLRKFQQGQVQLYIFYIALTLLALLAWKAG
ncbi:MAG: proton-conducting transporter membrane subunit [Candidatus Hydrogenedentota bacterium]